MNQFLDFILIINYLLYRYHISVYLFILRLEILINSDCINIFNKHWKLINHEKLNFYCCSNRNNQVGTCIRALLVLLLRIKNKIIKMSLWIPWKPWYNVWRPCNIMPWPAMNPAYVIDRYIRSLTKSTKWPPPQKKQEMHWCDSWGIKMLICKPWPMKTKHYVGEEAWSCGSRGSFKII